MPERDATENAPDYAHAEIGFVCALPMELAPLLDRCERVRKYTGGPFVFKGGRYHGARIVVVQSGPGFANARRATHALIDAHTPQWVLSSGYCGALREGMQIGEIVIANSLADTHGQVLEIDVKMQSQRGLHIGRLLTADHIIKTVAEKKQLAEQFDAIAVDMESLAVAQVCQETKTKFMCIRGISDDLSADLPDEIMSLLGATGTQRLGAVVGAVWKRPGSVKEMWQLRENAGQAADHLAPFLTGVIKQLVPTDNQDTNNA